MPPASLEAWKRTGIPVQAVTPAALESPPQSLAVRAPVTLIWGAADRMSPLRSARAIQQCPQTKLPLEQVQMAGLVYLCVPDWLPVVLIALPPLVADTSNALAVSPAETTSTGAP